jgi:adenosine deaminase
MQNFDPKYNLIPKIELHCHLEGSIRTQTILDIAQQYHLSLPTYDFAELDRHVKVREQLHDLQAVLDAFAIFQNSLVSVEAVERITYELCQDASRQNIRLLEIRFSPDWAFSGHNLDWDLALESIQHAQQRALADFGLFTGLIAITSRSLGVASCEKTVDWAIRHTDAIQGIDLADNERGHPISEFVSPVMRAWAAGLKVTVHTGEDTPASFVMDTIQAVHPDRIGHGIHIIEDPAVVEFVRQLGIPLEVNPWSNYLTNSVPTIQQHPLKRLFDLGVRVTINSDDPEVLDTNLNNEYRIAHEVLGMSLDEITACNRYALQASFLPEELKVLLQDQVPEWR